jgi:uncharacterized protein YqeY
VNYPDPGNEHGAATRGRLRLALDEALRTRDRIAVSAARSALSAIANAEAVSPPPAVTGSRSPHVAGAVAGVGAGDAPRRDLSAAEVDQVVRAEISERLQAASDYERAGHSARAHRLRSEASVLASALSGEAAQRHGIA